ncbi:MAG: DUF3618 domain-containing protein [Actinomycetota bacterium]|nr:DUF3618 domain-containing protein [Actinomycetota bacterium]
MTDDFELTPRYEGGIERTQPPVRPAPGTRSAEEIRSDIVRERQELGRSVEALRGRVTELTDWRRQAREHKRELIIGAVVVGFAVGARMALRRR